MTDDRTRDLTAYANAGAQPIQPQRPPQGHAIARQTSGIPEQILGAQEVAVHRDEAKILQKLSALAAAAGSDWFYRFPVRTKDGGSDWIEGPSIKLANDIARIFGNCAIQVRELDVGDAWVFYARFSDIETGFSMERSFRARKSAATLKTKDYDRQLDIAYQVGQSKAIRNVIVNSLQIYADYAFEAARNSLVEKIGKDLDGWRRRTLEGISRMPVGLARVERVVGRSAKDWLASDIAQIVAQMRAIADGMATADETFPPIEKTEKASGTPAAPAPGSAPQEAPASNPASAPAGQPSDDVEPPDDVDVAYERGKMAKQAGHNRKAMPGEYREPARNREAAMWLAGFDGKEMPSGK